MKVQDAFRAQYFLAILENEIAKVENYFSDYRCFARPLKSILNEFVFDLYVELDQLLLPTLVFEIHKAQKQGFLYGETPAARYESFFIQDNRYSEYARSILKTYPPLFERIDVLIHETLDAFCQFVHRFWNDYNEVKKWLLIPPDVMVHSIQMLKGADRHRGKQAYVVSFSDGSKAIYKPVDLTPDWLFRQFVQSLDLDEPYNLQTLEIFPRDGYGWIKYIDQEDCKNIHEVEDFYRRIGVLLAVASALNYTDGHCENLIAYGAFPVLIDGETFFQNYSPEIVKKKNILATLLIQKNQPEEDRVFVSALQAPHGIKFDYLQTHAINDHTDEIEIRYFGLNPSPHHHCPTLNGKPFSAHDYVHFIIEGYCKGYSTITERVEKILNNKGWWKLASRVKARIVLRETMAYIYLLRKIQQPDWVRSHKETTVMLSEKLGSKPYTGYEVADLLKMNIPYFYHFPGERDLYDGNDHRYANVFEITAIEGLRNQFLNRSKEKMLFDCEILARHLIPITIEQGQPMVLSI